MSRGRPSIREREGVGDPSSLPVDEPRFEGPTEPGEVGAFPEVTASVAACKEPISFARILGEEWEQFITSLTRAVILSFLFSGRETVLRCVSKTNPKCWNRL